MSDKQYAYSLLEVKERTENADGVTITGIASTPTTDRMGDIVEPMGAEFKTPMPLLLHHMSSMPVGQVTFAKAQRNGIPFKAFLPFVKEPGTLKTRIDEAIQSLKHGLIGAVSIGFRSKEREPIDPDKPYGGIRFLKWEWLELSLVTIPANAEATIQTVKSLDAQQRAASGQQGSTSVTSITRSGVSERITSTQPSSKGKAMKVSISEQIANFEAERSHKAARMQELMSASLDENRTFNNDEDKEYSELEDAVSAIDKQVEAMKRHEKLLLATTTPVSGTETTTHQRSNAGSPVLFQKSNKPAGTAFTRLCMAVAAGKGSRSDTELYIRDHFRDTPEVGLMYKAAQNAGTTTDSNWAAPLVNYTDLASEFVDLLRPATIIGRMTSVRRVPFNIRFAKLASGVSSGWVGQGAPKPVGQMDFDTVTFAFTKLASIVVLTEELVRFSNPAAEALCRDELIRSIAQAMNQTFIDPTVSAVANVSPASITNGATSQASSGTSVANITTDLTWAMTQPATANIDMSTGVWIMRPQTAVYLSTLRSAQDTPAFPQMGLNGGTLYGFPVIVSGDASYDTGTSQGFIAFVVQSEILVADDGATRVDAATQASIQMDNAPTAGAASLVSLWQNNLVALRAERFVNWARRRDAAVSVITSVAY